MSDTSRWIIIGSAVVAAVGLLVIGIVVGRVTSRSDAALGADSSVSDSIDSTGLQSTSTIPSRDVPAEYGTIQARDDLVTALTQRGLTGGNYDVILTTADEVCFNLERLEAQDRSPAFAVRVVWNESLAQLPSIHIAAFAAVFVAAPRFLCRDSIGYADDIAYWLGY
jgi:hypothetical protein